MKRVDHSVTRGVPSVVVAPASPMASAGVSIVLDGTSSSDPQGDRLSAWWDFRDGSLELPGLATRHAWHVPGSYEVELAVTDREGNVVIEPTNVTVGDGGVAGLLWADAFDDLRLDGWTWSAAQASFGIVSGALRQGTVIANAPGPVWQTLVLDGPGWAELVVESDITLAPLASDATGAGIHVRRASPSDTPDDSGYHVELQSDGNLVVYEAGALALGPVSYGNPSTPHHVEVRVEDYSSSLKLFVRVDGQLLTWMRDITPQSGSGVALVTDNHRASYAGVVIRSAQ